MKRFENPYLTSILGIVIGVLATLVVVKVTDKREFDGDYGRWRKLNLILQEVEKNYVDTIDMKRMFIISLVCSILMVMVYTGTLFDFMMFIAKFFIALYQH